VLVGVNPDASLFCAAPGSGFASRHVVAARSVRFGSAGRRAALSSGGPVGRSRRHNTPGLGRNSCTPRPGCGSRRTGKVGPMQLRRGRRGLESADKVARILTRTRLLRISHRRSM
jgi:hypothetical protein